MAIVSLGKGSIYPPLNQILPRTESKINLTPVVQTLRATINKWDLLKLRHFCKAKNMVNKTKWQPTEWEKIFTNSTSDKKLISKIYK